MINRILLRIKIVQLLYAYMKNQSKSLDVAEKELFYSLDQTYNLYHFLLLLIPDITFYGKKRLDSAKNKLCPTPEELNPNSKFVDNSFAALFSENEAFVKYIKEHKLSWVNYPTTIKNLYETIVSSDFYIEYMNSSTSSFEEDRDLWRKIFKRCILSNEELLTSLEEQSIYWNDDLEIVVSFILKTIKKFDFEDGRTKPLLPMFKDDEDRMFASKLFRSAILNGVEYKALIDEHTKNWEIDRIAFMDVVIMQLALAEIQNFPTIPVNVTLNEYIEISKTYSTDRSSNFINGVLDNIVTQLKNENKLVKAKIFSLNQK
ncbi:MAG: transcription antitermination factor NusB [Paludibacteraceae bacterium]|nr:transcription antitermination factor NusB [Paludibacteraceae bacterium]